jgi:hypothetical protein
MSGLVYPTPTQLKSLERKTLQSIQKMGCLKKSFGTLVLAANQNCTNLDPKRGGLDFSTSFEVHTAQERRRVDIGALINVDEKNCYEAVSYFFAIGKDCQAQGHILRKLHFDFENPTRRNPKEIKPSMHIQVGGKLTPSMARAGYTNQHLENHFPWFEKPRIPSIPFSIALLLDWLFLEFCDTPEINEVIQAGEWRNLVRDVENELLGPFFQGCHDFLKNPKRDGLLLANLFYGLQP